MQYEELPLPDATPVKLLDRVVGAPAYERYFDGAPRVAKKQGQIEMLLPRNVAIWLLQRDRDKVWAMDGGYVHRFALVEPDEEVIARCGRDILDADPIDLDPAMKEGWNVNDSPTPRREVVYSNLTGRDLADARRLLNERLAGAASFVKG